MAAAVLWRRLSRTRPTAGAALALLLLLSLVCGLSAGAGAAKAQQFRSTRAAFEQGIQAYRAGYFRIAIPGLRFAADRGSLLAKFYLARIYADPDTAQTDHGAAYKLYFQIASNNLDIDAAIDPRALYVAKALTAVARYVRSGIPSIGVKPNPRKAAGYLRHSANHFGDTEAQFELAKLYLRGDGVSKNIGLGLHFLSVLTTQKSYAPAQAFLADMLWRGRYVKQNKAKALALIAVAVANAPKHERFWIEDIYQNIYCGTSIGTRRQASGLVADWRDRYGGRILHPRRPRASDMPQAIRTCGNGEEVVPVERSQLDGWLRATKTIAAGDASNGDSSSGDVGKLAARSTARLAARSEKSIKQSEPAAAMAPAMQGSMDAFSLRNVGESLPPR